MSGSSFKMSFFLYVCICGPNKDGHQTVSVKVLIFPFWKNVLVVLPCKGQLLFTSVYLISKEPFHYKCRLEARIIGFNHAFIPVDPTHNQCLMFSLFFK